MVENANASIVRDCWLDLPNHYPHVSLDAFVVMPDHIHGIIVLLDTFAHIPHLQKNTSAITCSRLQRVIAVFGHFRVIGAYFEKCSIDNSAGSTD